MGKGASPLGETHLIPSRLTFKPLAGLPPSSGPPLSQMQCKITNTI